VTGQPFWRTQLPSIAVGLADVFAIGLGMGVPIFAIIAGFPIGWWLARRAKDTAPSVAEASAVRPLRALLIQAGALAGVSLLVLAVVWGPHVPKAFDPAVDASGFGIPLILYGEQASMIGWLVLMLVISPILQFMATVTGGAVALAFPRAVPDAADRRTD
jgi:hypothetical protein